MRLRSTGLNDPAARLLIFRQWSEVCRRYGMSAPGDEDQALPSGSFAPPDGTFMVGEVGGLAVACGGLRPCQDAVAAVGEIKRMYVDPAARGQGLGRALLDALEAEGRRLGYERLWLESGTAQPEALHLFETAGWALIPAYGGYKGEEDSRCYAKALIKEDDACVLGPGG